MLFIMRYQMKVQIEMATKQTVDGETQEFVHRAAGILREEADGSLLLSYLLDGVHHDMQISPAEREVRIVKNRDTKNPLLYRENHCHEMLYETPVGAMDLGFETREISVLQGKEPGSWQLGLRYAMLQYGRKLADCELSIAISQAR